MRDIRPAMMSRPSEQQSSDPLLDTDEDELGQKINSRINGHISDEGTAGSTRGRDATSNYTSASREHRRHEMRSRSPGEIARYATRQKIWLAALALLISLVTFVVQTETAVYIQHDLGWKKPYCMLYMTHGSWVVLWPLQILYLRLRKHSMPWRSFIRSHLRLVKSTAQMTMFNTNRISTSQAMVNPIPYALKQCTIIASTLTVAGSSWYIAVNMTTPSDLTAIYNCSAFFAYVFSVPLLKERVRMGKVVSVAIAIVGVLVVAYGDGKAEPEIENNGDGKETVRTKNRVLGNLIIGVGSILYGFYEVLYKKLACPPENTSPGRSVLFANIVASGIGLFTLTVLWIPLPILHWTGAEEFVLPRGEVAWMLAISVLSNVAFSGAFLALISLTSPVLSSVAALLTIFLVAITDWFLTGIPLTFAAMAGGLLIIGAFGLLSWESWREIVEERERRAKKGDDVEDLDEEEESEVFVETGPGGDDEDEVGGLLDGNGALRG